MNSAQLYQALSVLLPPLYLVAAALHGMAFGGDRAPQVKGLRTWTLHVAVLLHALTFGIADRALGAFPINDAWTTLSATALFVALFYDLIAVRTKHPGTGGVVLSVVFLLQLAATAMESFDLTRTNEGYDAFRILHIATIVLAASAVVLSGIHGALYLVLFRKMRAKEFGPLFSHLPDLSLLARMTRQAALSGFIGLTIGLNVGIGLAHADKIEGFSYTQPSVILTIAIWLHFGVIAFSRYIKGFTARRASWAAATGLIALLLTVVLTFIPHFAFHSVR